jgi:type IV pilus assembly protein PilC
LALDGVDGPESARAIDAHFLTPNSLLATVVMEFVCKLGTEAGVVTSQTEQATSERELRQRLASEGYYIFSIRPQAGLGSRVLRFRRAKISADDFLIFNQQFLTLSKSGLPLQKSLDLLVMQTRADELRGALEAVTREVRAGKLLSEAFESVGKFPKIYAATLRAGERSGNLDKILSQYLSYQKTTRGFRKKFLSALIYPAFLVCFLIGLISFVVTFIVPRFALLYADLGVTLPPMTEFVIGFSRAANRWLVLILAGLGIVVFASRAALRSPRTRLALDRLKLRLPVAGKLLLKFSVAEFARTLSTLLQGGLPIVPALETTKDSVTSPLLAECIRDAQREVTAGHTLSSGLRRSGFFPSIALDMVEVGESTGALPTMLESLAEFFEEDVNIDLGTLVALIDPLMIAAIAIFVAFILVAFYLPLFSLAAQVH